MKSKDNENDSNYDSILFDEEEEIKLYKGVMKQNISKKNIVLSREISKKKRIVNRLFKERFDKNFLPIKLESLRAFGTFVKFYLFSPQSKILSKFPKLKKQILKEKDINYNSLKDKINVGSLLYLNLSGNGTALNKNINEKFFQISKNLSTSISKDTISNQVYNVKFLKKNAQRINKILSYKGKKIKEIENNKNNDNNNNNTNIIKQKINLKKTKNKTINAKNINKNPHRTYDNFYKNKILNNNSNNENYYLNTEGDNFPILNKTKNSNSKKLSNNNNNIKTINNLKLKNSLKKYNSRNIKSNLTKLDGLTTTLSKCHDNYSTKTFSPYSTFTHLNNKKYNILKQAKNLQNDINKYVENLNNQTDDCNKKLIKLINGNIKQKIKTTEEENQEVINLKNILIDKKKMKKKKKINNIIQIKRLIKNAKLDIEGEANLEKIKKREIKKLGQYLNVMNNENALYKVNELFTKAQLKREGKNFSQEELQRLRKRKIREIEVFNSRNNAKNNYLKMIKMKNDLKLIKDKFDKIDMETTNRTIEIKKNRNINI